MSLLTEIFEFIDRLDLFWKVAGLAGLGLALMSIIYSRLFFGSVFRALSPTGKIVVLSLAVVSVGAVALAAVLVWRPQPFILPSPTASLESPVPANPSQSPLPSPYAPIKSSCRMDVRNVGSKDVEMSVGQIQCVERPADKLQVSYVWVDPETYSQLVWGTKSVTLRNLFGAAPVVLVNDVHKAFQDLQDRYGTLLDGTSCTARRCKGGGWNVQLRKPGDSGWKTPGQQDSSSNSGNPTPYAWPAMEGAKILDYAPTFLFPDLESMKTLIQTDGWPQSYNLDVDAFCLTFTEPSWSADQCPTDMPFVWRTVTAEELKSHTLRMEDYYQHFIAERREYGLQQLWAKSDRKQRGEQAPPRDAQIDPEFQRDLITWPQRTANMLAYVAKGEIPEGFVVAKGQLKAGHSPEDFGWSIEIQVPSVRILVMVMEIVGPAGATFDLAGLEQADSQDSSLRRSAIKRKESVSTTKLPLDVLSTDRQIVVPMKIEFVPEGKSYWGEKGWWTETTNPQAKAEKEKRRSRYFQTWDQQARNGADPFTKYPTRLRKSMIGGSYRVREFPYHAFLYGPEHRPTSLILKDGRSLPIRQFDPNFVIIENGSMKGSCPFVDVKRGPDSAWRRIGPILVGAVGKGNSREESIELGADITSVRIVEDEAEISILDSITAFGKEKRTGTYVPVVRKERIRLTYGEAVDIVLPKRVRSMYSEYRLTVEGHYVTYRMALGQSD